MEISKELLSEVLGIRYIAMNPILEPMNKIGYLVYGSQNTIQEVRSNHKQINIYELVHKNLKQWAKLKNVFDIIDWSEEPEQIFKKVEEIRNEKQLQH